MSWQFSKALNIGGRSEQQDSVEILSTDHDDSHLIVVADGMGGHWGGALASKMVIHTARRLFSNGRDPDPENFLRQLCMESHKAITELGYDGHKPPGSTCVILYVTDNEAYWAHVGDSRLYHFCNGKLQQQTTDHSVVQLMVDRGDMSEDEAANSGMQNQLYMCLGGNHVPDPELAYDNAVNDEVFVLCTDGFWAHVHPEEVIKHLKKERFEEDCAARLVELARGRGGDTGDNIGLAVIRKQGRRTLGRMLRRAFGYVNRRETKPSSD